MQAKISGTKYYSSAVAFNFRIVSSTWLVESVYTLENEHPRRPCSYRGVVIVSAYELHLSGGR